MRMSIIIKLHTTTKVMKNLVSSLRRKSLHLLRSLLLNSFQLLNLRMVTIMNNMEKFIPERNWKTPTLISFLERLKNRGFLTAEKSGREYVYTPLVDRNEYVAELSRSFFERVHGGSVASLMEAVFSSREFGAREAEELLGWLETRARGGHGQSEIL